MLTYVALSIYTFKNMRNINIPSGRGIILSGDRQKAGTYLGIAKRKMHDMKQMMSLGNLRMMRRVHYLDRDCVWVHLTSIDGADFIRIHSCAEGEECSLSLTATDLGTNKAQLDFRYKTPDKENFYAIWIDTGGLYLSGNNQYSAISIPRANIGAVASKTLTFLNPGDYSITGYGYKSVNFVTHSASWPIPTGVPSYEVDLDMGTITKAVVRMAITVVNSSTPAQVFVNDVLVFTTGPTTFAVNVFIPDLEITSTMNIRITTADVLRSLSIVFTEVKCLAQVTKDITVT